MEASLVFREAWEKAKTWEGYVRRKEDFLEKQGGRRMERELGDGNSNDKNVRKKRKRKMNDPMDG